MTPVSLEVKPTPVRSLTPVALGTALVLVTYVTPMATVPATAADLGAGPAARAWILSSMSVGLAAALLATGVLGDTYGRRRVYAAGLATLGIGALLCAIAQEPWLFVAGRVLEGAGGAAVLACGLAVLAHDFPPGPARVHATSVWGASVGLGITAGVVLAAALDIGSGWREAYAATALLAALLLVPSLARIDETSAARPRRVDLPGLVLLAATATLVVSALTQGRDGVDAASVVLGALAVLAGLGLAVAERRVPEPLVEPELLRSAGFRVATLGSFTLGVGIIGMSSYVPAVAQVGLGASLWTASLLVVGWSGTSVLTSYLVRHLPRQPPAAAMFVLVALGQVLGYGLDATSSPWRLLAPMVVAGLGTGVLNALLGREAVASVPPDRAAMGSGANNTARYLGAAVGITLFVVVATHAGDTVVDGWNVAVLVSAAATLTGALLVALSRRGGERRSSAR